MFFWRLLMTVAAWLSGFAGCMVNVDPAQDIVYVRMMFGFLIVAWIGWAMDARSANRRLLAAERRNQNGIS